MELFDGSHDPKLGIGEVLGRWIGLNVFQPLLQPGKLSWGRGVKVPNGGYWFNPPVQQEGSPVINPNPGLIPVLPDRFCWDLLQGSPDHYIYTHRKFSFSNEGKRMGFSTEYRTPISYDQHHAGQCLITWLLRALLQPVLQGRQR